MIHTLSGRVARRRLARKEEMFETALRLAQNEGRDGLTVYRLAEALDLTPGALYRYFPSKDIFMAELQDHVQKGVLALFRSRRAQWEALPALGRLLAAADFYLDLRKTAPEFANLLGLLIGDPREFTGAEGSERLVSSAQALFAELESLIGEAEGCGALRPGGRREKTLIYWAALHGATQIVKLEKVEPGLRESRYYGMRMARTLLLGWGASARDVEKAWRGVA